MPSDVRVALVLTGIEQIAVAVLEKRRAAIRGRDRSHRWGGCALARVGGCPELRRQGGAGAEALIERVLGRGSRNVLGRNTFHRIASVEANRWAPLVTPKAPFGSFCDGLAGETLRHAAFVARKVGRDARRS